MTLTINLSLSAQTFIVTCSEINPITTGSTIYLVNQYSNTTNTYNLPDDSSPYPDRYNQFILPTSTFSGLTDGTYTFIIFDSGGNVTERGLLKVIDLKETTEQEIDNQYIFIASDSTDDEFIVIGS